MNRVVASITACGSVFLLGIGTVFSFNLWSEWRPLASIDRYANFGYFEILDYLTAKFPDIDSNQYTIKGYGEALPVADNATAEKLCV